MYYINHSCNKRLLLLFFFVRKSICTCFFNVFFIFENAKRDVVNSRKLKIFITKIKMLLMK